MAAPRRAAAKKLPVVVEARKKFSIIYGKSIKRVERNGNVRIQKRNARAFPVKEEQSHTHTYQPMALILRSINKSVWKMSLSQIFMFARQLFTTRLGTRLNFFFVVQRSRQTDILSAECTSSRQHKKNGTQQKTPPSICIFIVDDWGLGIGDTFSSWKIVIGNFGPVNWLSH